MLVRRSAIALGLVVLAAACTDSLAPRRPSESTPHFVRWAPATQPQFTALGAASSGTATTGDGQILLSGPSDLSLNLYQASFWAVRGQTRYLYINYLSATGGTEQPFLRLRIDDPRYVPGRGDLQSGDSVLVTVTVDSADIAIRLEPSGLVFGNPAQLRIWYGGAGGDLNGDGLVDATDAMIEQQLLGMWYQEGPGSPWTPIAATQSLTYKSLTSYLAHFSGYAVSW